MSAEIINLRQFRKGKARQDKEKEAEQNRLTFGRTKSEKSLTRALNEKAEKSLDQGRLQDTSEIKAKNTKKDPE